MSDYIVANPTKTVWDFMLGRVASRGRAFDSSAQEAFLPWAVVGVPKHIFALQAISPDGRA